MDCEGGEGGGGGGRGGGEGEEEEEGGKVGSEGIKKRAKDVFDIIHTMYIPTFTATS